MRYQVIGDSADSLAKMTGPAAAMVPESPSSAALYEKDKSLKPVLSNQNNQVKTAPAVEVLDEKSRAVDADEDELVHDENLQEALAAAKARIDLLTKEVDDQKSMVSSTKAAVATKRPAPGAQEGLSIPQAALLVVISFLVGWLLF